MGGDANRYGYVANNPVRYGDPLGLDKQTKTRWECGGLASIRDYLALQVSVGPGGGVQGQFVVDRYGQIYLAFGGQIGRAKSYACWITRRGCTLAWNQNQASPVGAGGKRRHPRAHENTGIGADEPEA